MADLYNQVIVGDGVSTYSISNNTRNLQPTSEIGTPRLTPLYIQGLRDPITLEESGSADDWFSSKDGLAKNSAQFKVVQALQQFVTIYKVGDTRGESSFFTVLCRDSSIPYDGSDTFKDVGNNITKLQDAVRLTPADDDFDYGGVIVKIGMISDDDTDNSFPVE
jgi:hypothetical protein